jgi:hypothetical protein
MGTSISKKPPASILRVEMAIALKMEAAEIPQKHSHPFTKVHGITS